MKRDDPFWIQLDEVPQAGLSIDMDLPIDWQNAALGPIYGPGDGRPHVRIRALRNADQLSIQGEVDLSTKCQCSRCAEPLEKDFHFRVAALFIPAAETDLTPEDDLLLQEPDLQICDYEARTFSIEQPFIEAAVMNVPAYPLCTEDCKGLCSGCGANLNVEKCSCETKGSDPRWAPLAGLKVALKKQKRPRGSGGTHGSTEEKALKGKDKNPKVGK